MWSIITLYLGPQTPGWETLVHLVSLHHPPYLEFISTFLTAHSILQKNQGEILSWNITNSNWQPKNWFSSSYFTAKENNNCIIKWPGLIVSFKRILISTKFSMNYASIFSFSLLSVCTVYVYVSTPHICLSVYSYLCFNSFIFMSILHLQATFTFTWLNRWTWGVIQKELRTKKSF